MQNKISTDIDTFFQTSKESTPIQRNIQLVNITRLLTSALGCADEKVSVASTAADISDRHKLRLDTDFARLESGEIAELIRFGPADHPAFVHGSTMGMSRSESRRLALAQAKKNEEELHEFRKEQIGRRGQLVANEEKAASARGAAARKKVMAMVAGTAGPGSSGGGGGVGAMNGVGLGFSGMGILGGKGTPPRGATPVATAALISGGAGETKKSHHKKKPPRDNEENIPTATNAGQKRKHPNQYTSPLSLVASGWLLTRVCEGIRIRLHRRIDRLCRRMQRVFLAVAVETPTKRNWCRMTAFKGMKRGIVIVIRFPMGRWLRVIEMGVGKNGIPRKSPPLYLFSFLPSLFMCCAGLDLTG